MNRTKTIATLDVLGFDLNAMISRIGTHFSLDEIDYLCDPECLKCKFTALRIACHELRTTADEMDAEMAEIAKEVEVWQ